MQAFDYVSAQSVDEAVALLQKEGEMARPLAGGTDLIAQLKEGRRQLNLVVDLKRIPDLMDLRYDPEEGLWLGASVPCHRINKDAEVAEHYPALLDSTSLIGGIQIQGRASVGGNLCNASPAADSIPNLIVHNVICHVAGPNGRREVPVEDFCVAPGRTVLEEGEFLVTLQFPVPQSGFGAGYLRFIPRNEMDIAIVGAGASVVLDEDGETIKDARIALGAVAPRPLFVEEAGAALVGKTVSDEAIDEAARIAQTAASPISDMRGTVAQRKHLSAVLTRRALRMAIDRAQGKTVERHFGRKNGHA